MVYFLMFLVVYKHTTGRIIKARISRISRITGWLIGRVPTPLSTLCRYLGRVILSNKAAQVGII